MPEVRITIGTREYEVACQEGEEHFLKSAADLLDREAKTLVDQIGRLPEARMLLMAGLMLADKTAGLEESVRALEERVAAAEAREPEQVEVARVPREVTELAARAEALAEAAEEKAGA